MAMVKMICQHCDIEFKVKPHKLAAGKGKYCSRKCYGKASRNSKRGPYSNRKPRVQRVCKECGTSFEVVPSQASSSHGIFCSLQCNGRHNGKKRGRPPVERKCVVCGNDFKTRLEEIEAGRGLCCSVKCAGKKRTSDKKLLLESSPFVCQCCGKEFFEKRRVGKVRRYCSNSCRGMSNRKLEKAPSKRNKKEHAKWVREVILRDKMCVRCGARERLQAHHVLAVSKHPELELEVSNGVTLCPCCHHAEHPSFPIEVFLKNGGKSVLYCIVCENPFVPRTSSQRACGRNCSQKLIRRRKSLNKKNEETSDG